MIAQPLGLRRLGPGNAEMPQDEIAQRPALRARPPIGLDDDGGIILGHRIDEGLAIGKDALALHRFEQGAVDLLGAERRRGGARRGLRHAEQRGQGDSEMDRSAHGEAPPSCIGRRNE